MQIDACRQLNIEISFVYKMVSMTQFNSYKGPNETSINLEDKDFSLLNLMFKLKK